MKDPARWLFNFLLGLLILGIAALCVGGCSAYNNYTAATNKILLGTDYEPQRWGESSDEYRARTGYAGPTAQQGAQILEMRKARKAQKTAGE